MRTHEFIRLLILVSCVLTLSCGDDDPAAPTGGGGPAPLSFNDFQDAAVVVGQVTMTGGALNAGGGSAGSVGVNGPAGSGSGSFYIPDTFNHRILGYDGIPTADGEAADFVIGQPNFTTVASGTTAQNFNLPGDCFVSGGKLFVTDGSNHRVLIWNSLPTANTPADVVVGQADFTSNGIALTQSGMALPFRVFVAGGKLFVGELTNRRVMIWNSIPTTNGEPADVVVGQADFTSNVDALSAAGIDAPRGIWSDGTRLVISDAGNDRVLIWNSIPSTNGQDADVVLGAPDFTTAGSPVASATGVDGAWGVASDGTSLFVADTGNQRITIFSPFPTTSNAAATGVLGQSNFTNETRNDANQDAVADANPSARTLYNPTGLSVNGNKLIVADQSNNRILIFQSN